MTFIWPVMLLALVLLPVFVFMYIGLQRRRRRVAAKYGNPALLREGGRRLGARRHIPALMFLIALGVLIFALARPQTVVSLPRLEGTVILAFDVSGSMAADDLKPTRMEAAKNAAISFVQNQPSTVQIGVVSFSEGGFSVQAPTNDQGMVLAAIQRLTVQKGTSIGRGIDVALNAIAAGKDGPLTLSDRGQTPTPTPTAVPKGAYTSAVIVLITDGENTQPPDPMEAAQHAADRGVRIHTIGIGSTEGAVLKLDGFTVRSRLDEDTLKNISQLTGGQYYNAATEQDLNKIYDNLSPELVIKQEETEVTSLFAGLGILVLMIGGTLSLLWLGRLP